VGIECGDTSPMCRGGVCGRVAVGSKIDTCPLTPALSREGRGRNYLPGVHVSADHHRFTDAPLTISQCTRSAMDKMTLRAFVRRGGHLRAIPREFAVGGHIAAWPSTGPSGGHLR